MAKASLKQLDELHNAVAKQLADNLDDSKILAQAITFLKNNNITVDLQESKEVQNIFTTVNNLVKDSKDLKKDSVDSLLDEIAY